MRISMVSNSQFHESLPYFGIIKSINYKKKIILFHIRCIYYKIKRSVIYVLFCFILFYFISSITQNIHAKWSVIDNIFGQWYVIRKRKYFCIVIRFIHGKMGGIWNNKFRKKQNTSLVIIYSKCGTSFGLA